ncbi:MAG: isoprenylcysteine carboxylmethyltransferase family protein [Planctomycetota bacterium]
MSILLYGVLCYAVFLATFLYLMGFVTDVAVPRTVDRGGTPAAGLEHWILDLSLVALFGLQHAVMARRGFKRRWTRIVPAAAERSTFVLATCAVLALLFWSWRPIPEVVWTVQQPLAWWALTVVGGAGWAIVLLSTFLIDHFALFGLRQAWMAFRDRHDPAPRFVTRGFYRYVRHPLMTGFLLAMWATPHMTVGHLLFAAAITGYVLLGTALEERDLLAAHPAEYPAYRERTPALLPLGRRRVPLASRTG